MKMSQQEWYDLIKKKIEDKGTGYYMSWWLRIDTGIPTSTINYHLKKLVDRGRLSSKSNHYGIEYKLKIINHAKGTSRDEHGRV